MSEAMTAIGTIGDLVMGYKNAENASSIQHRMLSNANQAALPQTWQNVKNIVDAQTASQVGSGAPVLEGAREGMADASVLSEFQRNQQNALNGAYAMQGPTGNFFSQLMAALTGGLGGTYAFGNSLFGTQNQPSGITGMIDPLPGDPGYGYPNPFTGDSQYSPQFTNINTGDVLPYSTNPTLKSTF